KQQLAVAQEVELGQQVTFAAATKTTAKSRRNTVIVAALLGLLPGIFAALLWEPVGRIVRRPAYLRGMLDDQRVAVVVPAHDEEKLIAETIRSTPDFVHRVRVIDD